MSNKILVFIMLMSSGVAYADIYDDFIEEYLLESPKNKYISRYQNQEPPEGMDTQEWNIKVLKIEQLANKEFGRGGELFNKIKRIYKNNLTEKDMELLVEFSKDTKYKAVLNKHKPVKSEVMDVLVEYMFDEFSGKLSDIIHE